MSEIIEKLRQKHLKLLEKEAAAKDTPEPQLSFFDSGILLTVADVASFVGCSSRTIERCIKKGELKATKVGGKKLIRKEWVESWLNPMEV